MKILNLPIGFLVAILLFSCGNVEMDKKFSTIYDIPLGGGIASIKLNKLSMTEREDGMYNVKEVVFKGKQKNYEIYELSNREVNSLEGNIILYVKNDKVEKIEFVSSGIWLGDTGSADFLFDEFYNEREKWVQNAMSYYEIPKWQEGENLLYYEKNDIVHQYEIKVVEMMGIQMGWNLQYSITSENAIASELQTEKDNLKF